jgi:hypothetical protein
VLYEGIIPFSILKKLLESSKYKKNSQNTLDVNQYIIKQQRLLCPLACLTDERLEYSRTTHNYPHAIHACTKESPLHQPAREHLK